MAEWELSKENILPVKKGRALEQLGDGLKKPGLRKIEDNFEDIIRTAGDDYVRLLLAYSERYTWLRRRAGDNRSASQSLLERCTSSLLRFEVLHNDLRYVKLWIEYAECASDSLDVFAFMYAQGVGCKLALFWIAWAFVLEKKSNFQKADQIYHTGMKCFAEPKQLLAQRYQQFQRRLSRRYLNNVDGVDEEPPVVTDTSFVLGHQRNEIKAPAPVSMMMPVPQAAKSTINIFEDITLDENQKPVAPKWGSLAAEKDRTKENIGLTTNWINPVLPNLSSKSSSVPSSTVSQSFIFMDPEFMDERCAPQPPTSVPSIAAVARGAVPAVAPPVAVVTAEPIATAAAQAAINKSNKQDEDQTINTKLALEDIEKMFNSDDFGFIAAVSDYEGGNQQEDEKEEEDTIDLLLDDFVSQRRRNFTLKHLLKIQVPRVSRDDNNHTQHHSNTNTITDSSLPKAKRAKVATRQFEIVDYKQNDRFRAMCIEDNVLAGLQHVPLIKVASKIHPLQIAKQLGNVRQTFAVDTVQVGNTRWTLTESFARGKFGVALKVTSSSSSRNSIRIWKVHRDGSAAEWEAFIYDLLYARKRQCTGHTANLINFIIQPHELIQFHDATALSLPFGNCGTLINVLAIMQANYDYQSQEIQAAYFALQMLKAVHVLHEMEVLHCDIKTDNWVLQITAGSCQVQLIDFGKARLAKVYSYEDFPAMPYCDADFAYLGTVGAQGYCCSLELANKPWIYQPDYYGLAACLHQLLYLEDLSILHVTAEEAGRRGFGITDIVDDDLPVVEKGAKLIVPRQGPKRHWKGTMWQSLFASLLNPPNEISRKIDLMRFASEIESFLSTQSSTKNIMDAFVAKLTVQSRTRSKPASATGTKH